METSTVIQRIRTSVGHEAWRVTDYEMVRRLLADERLGRLHPDPENAARVSDSAMLGAPDGNYETEHVDHARTRTLLQPHFSAKLMRTLRPRIEALTAQLLDRLAQQTPPADLIDVVAIPLPTLVICELLGVPYADRDRFQAWTDAAGTSTDQDRSAQGMANLFEYGQELVARKRSAPGNDVISRLCADESLDDAEVSEYAMRLLFAGYETMVMQIGQGALHLLANLDQWQALLADPGLIDSATEEILRAPGRSGGGIPRYVRADLTIGDVVVRAGELVLLDLVAANHDPNVFDSPDRFDVARSASAHLAFGHGSNYCMGAPLARMELKVVFGQLIRRFPTMHLAVRVDELRFRTDQLTGSLVALPVTW